MFSCTADVSVRRHSVARSSGGSFGIDGLAELDGPPLPFGFFTCTLRNWNPRPACGTAFTSVRISMSVCSMFSADYRVYT